MINYEWVTSYLNLTLQSSRSLLSVLSLLE